MIWSCGLQHEGVISQKGHPSVLVILEGRNTPRITVFFRDVEACFEIEKQLAPFADIVVIMTVSTHLQQRSELM